jgi:hypothetical protein
MSVRTGETGHGDGGTVVEPPQQGGRPGGERDRGEHPATRHRAPRPQPAKHRNQSQAGRDDQRHDAEEHPPPAEMLGDQAADRGPDE